MARYAKYHAMPCRQDALYLLLISKLIAIFLTPVYGQRCLNNAQRCLTLHDLLFPASGSLLSLRDFSDAKL